MEERFSDSEIVIFSKRINKNKYWLWVTAIFAAIAIIRILMSNTSEAGKMGKIVGSTFIIVFLFSYGLYWGSKRNKTIKP